MLLRNVMDLAIDLAAKPICQVQKTYWMHELWVVLPCGLNDRVEDETKANNTHINVSSKFSTLPRKYNLADCKKKNTFVSLFLAKLFLNASNHMLNTNIKDVQDFIFYSISFHKKSSYLCNIHESLSSKLCQFL